MQYVRSFRFYLVEVVWSTAYKADARDYRCFMHSFWFRMSAEKTSHSLFRELCTRISYHSPCPEGTHQSSSLLCWKELIKTIDKIVVNFWPAPLGFARRDREPLPVSGALHENPRPLAMPRRCASLLLPASLY